MSKRYFLLGAIALVLMTCARESEQKYVKDGVEYGVTESNFRGRWWSYYERGTSFLAGGYAAEAEADFKQAIIGRSSDTWQARTYGLHFVDYFPNRELGVAYFQQDRLDEAETQLRKSLEQIDTARAHDYLDRVLRQKIAAGTIKDDEAPVIAPVADDVLVLKDRILTGSREVALTITANDDVGVSDVTVNGEALHQRGSDKALEFKHEVLLTEGKQEITVAADDLADKSAEKKVEVIVDLTGPTIGIFEPADNLVTEADTIPLAGASVDVQGVISVLAEDETLIAEVAPGENHVEFFTDIPLQAGENSFIIAAKDAVGNETRTGMKVFRGDKDSVEAKLWQIKQRAPELLRYASTSPAALNAMFEAFKAQVAENPVEIEITSPREGQVYRHNKTIQIDGSVNSPTKVTTVLVNGEAFTPMIQGTKVAFSRRIPLTDDIIAQGTATVEVQVAADDESGAQATKAFSVEVNPQFFDSDASRLPVAMWPFKDTVEGSQIGMNIWPTLTTHMTDIKRFSMVERSQIEAILLEQELSQLAPEEQAVRGGKLINAYGVIIGDVAPFGTEATISARLVDVETSKILVAADSHVKDVGNAESAGSAADSLAAEINVKYPRLVGSVVKTSSRKLLLSWSKADGVQEGMQILVYLEEADDFGDVEYKTLGRAVISKVTDNSVQAELIDPAEGDASFAEGMPVVTM